MITLTYEDNRYACASRDDGTYLEWLVVRERCELVGRHGQNNWHVAGCNRGDGDSRLTVEDDA